MIAAATGTSTSRIRLTPISARTVTSTRTVPERDRRIAALPSYCRTVSFVPWAVIAHRVAGAFGYGGGHGEVDGGHLLACGGGRPALSGDLGVCARRVHRGLACRRTGLG